MSTPKPKLNTTPDGQIACAFGTPWLDHFAPPVGTGAGCVACWTKAKYREKGVE